MATNPGKSLTHTWLLQKVWGHGYGTESNYLATVHSAASPRNSETCPPNLGGSQPNRARLSPGCKNRGAAKHRALDLCQEVSIESETGVSVEELGRTHAGEEVGGHGRERTENASSDERHAFAE